MLRALADGLWVVDHPDFKLGFLEMGARTTVVRLATRTFMKLGDIVETGGPARLRDAFEWLRP